MSPSPYGSPSRSPSVHPLPPPAHPAATHKYPGGHYMDVKVDVDHVRDARELPIARSGGRTYVSLPSDWTDESVLVLRREGSD